MDYRSRHPIVYDDKTEAERKNSEHDKLETKEEFVINQIYCLFDFNRTNGSITRYIGQPSSTRKNDQSQRSTHTREQNQANHSLETTTPQNSIISFQTIIDCQISKRTKLAG